jgi:hypothetical protein
MVRLAEGELGARCKVREPRTARARGVGPPFA